MNKKGFTLIELLAVIIILGILMIIAIPSVTKYISDSRKSAYIDTAKEIIAGARNIVNEGKLEMYDTDATYYLDINCIKTENALKSPYGEFTKAYVIVTYNGKGYEYFWVSVDDAGEGIRKITRIDKLDTDSIESDLKEEDIPDSIGIDGRSRVVLVTERNHCQKEGSIDATGQVNSKTGEENNPVTYPEGKDKSTVITGDLVTIGTEEFYVVKHNGNDLILLAHYNLNVGSNAKGVATGKQDPDVKGYITNGTVYGTVAYSSTNYWEGKVGNGLTYDGHYCSTLGEIQCAYVYDSNSNLKTYVDTYKNILESMGASIKEARLLRVEEANELGCYSDCNSAPSFIRETSYWLGSPWNKELIWYIYTNGTLNNNSYYAANKNGVRPVIVI